MRSIIVFYYVPLGVNVVALVFNVWSLLMSAWRGTWIDHAVSLSVAILCSAMGVMSMPWFYVWGWEKAEKARAETEIADAVLDRMHAEAIVVEPSKMN